MAIYLIANVDVGTYLTVVLVLIVFSEYLPLFEYCFFGYCFPVKFARERIQFLTDHLTDPFLSSVIPMVAPIRSHRANGGNPIVGES